MQELGLFAAPHWQFRFHLGVSTSLLRLSRATIPSGRRLRRDLSRKEHAENLSTTRLVVRDHTIVFLYAVGWQLSNPCR